MLTHPEELNTVTSSPTSHLLTITELATHAVETKLPTIKPSQTVLGRFQTITGYRSFVKALEAFIGEGLPMEELEDYLILSEYVESDVLFVDMNQDGKNETILLIELKNKSETDDGSHVYGIWISEDGPRYRALASGSYLTGLEIIGMYDVDGDGSTEVVVMGVYGGSYCFLDLTVAGYSDAGVIDMFKEAYAESAECPATVEFVDLEGDGVLEVIVNGYKDCPDALTVHSDCPARFVYRLDRWHYVLDTWNYLEAD